MTGKSRFWKNLFNPFEQIGGSRAVFYALVFAILGFGLAYTFKARFDGVLNLHFYGQSPEWQIVAADIFINWLCLALCFYLLALAFGAGKSRFIDMLGGSGFAMYPLMVLPLVNAGGTFSTITAKLEENPQSLPQNLIEGNLALLVLAGLVLLMFIIWHVALLYNAYRISSNLKGIKIKLSFVLALLLAIILSKYLINIIPQMSI